MDTETAQTDASERECDKLLSRVSAEETQNGQRYVNNADCNRSPQHAAGFSGNIQGDHMSTTSQSTKQSDFQQLRIVEETHTQSNEKSSNIKRKILKFAVSLMFLLMAVGVIAIWTFHDGGKVEKNTKYFSFDEDDLVINVEIATDYDVVKTLSGKLGGVVFTGEAGTPREPEKCKRNVRQDNNHCIYWNEGTTLKVKLLKFDNGAQCYSFKWENISVIIPQDCYFLRFGDWYGMLSYSSEMWPISTTIPESIYGPGIDKKIGNVPEYYWLSTSGSAIYIVEDSPFQLSWNNSKKKQFCLSPLVSNYPESQSSFSYAVCQGSKMKQIHTAISQHFFPHLSHGFNTSSINLSTNGFHFSYSNENSYLLDKNDLVQYLSRLQQLGFQPSTVDIGSVFENEYGDLMIFNDKINGTDLSDLSGILQGFNTVVTINPVCSLSSKAFNYGVRNNLLIKDSVTNVIKLIKYGKSDVALWDIHSPATREWLKHSIRNITSKMSVKHLKFSGIDTSLLSLDDQMTTVGSTFYQLWTELLAEITQMPILQATFRSQNIPLFIEVNTELMKIQDKDCISYTLPATLIYGLFGYPFVISNSENLSGLEDELFIRWFQLSLFMPSLSIPSSLLNMKEETISYAINGTYFRQDVINTRMQSLLSGVSESNPILKPLWWMDGDDKITFGIDDEFLFGDDILVAPILCFGVRYRDIYLPKGAWLYPDTNDLYSGKQWLKDFHVPLYTVPYFILQKEEETTEDNL